MNIKELVDKGKKLVFFHKKRIIIISPLVLVVFSLLIYLYIKNNTIVSSSAPISSYSTAKLDEDRTYFSLNTESGYLFKSKKDGDAAVIDFLKQRTKELSERKLLPKNIDKNTVITRVSSSNGVNGTTKHYSLTQTINQIPIYGSSLLVHLKNGNEIYSVSGNLSLNNKITMQKITEEQARQIAINSAIKENPATKFLLRDIRKYIFNSKIMYLSEDAVNHLSLGMYVDSENKPLTYSTFYLIDLETGKILLKVSQFKDALLRTIKNCSGGGCVTIRQEGGPASGNADGDAVYSIFAQIYDYFSTNFSRDSYNGVGGPYIGNVNVNFARPNAAWDGQQMQFSRGLVVKDIAWHELTHALTQYTAGLAYEKQSGALNESVSDIFGSESDNNWTMGEGSAIGIIRSMSNPGSLSRPQPDKLFSSNYYCNGLTTMCEQTANDFCGVHTNSGVMNKTYFLMTDGGDFNGCSIAGVGRQRSSAIMYSALTNYLTSTSNFYDMYSAIQQACADRYDASSGICNEVKKAAQATELDQQTPGDQAGSKCTGGVVKPATCTGIPTSAISPTPTGTGGTNPTTDVPTPTSQPGVIPTATPIPGSSPVNTPPVIPTPNGGKLKTVGTPTPTPVQYFTCVPDPSCAKKGKSIQLCPLVCTPKP